MSSPDQEPAANSSEISSGLPVPAYVLDHGDPAALFTRLQRVVIHVELLQSEAVKAFDLSFRDFVILATLAKERAPHQLEVSQVARYVLRPMGSISQGLDRIEKAGLVVRMPSDSDRRKVIVQLTGPGKELADKMQDAYGTVRQGVFEHLDPEQLTTIDNAITDLLGALDANYLDKMENQQ